MRIIQFAKWWWKKNDPFVRTIVPFVLFWLLPCLALTPFFREISVILIVSGILTIAVGWGIYGIFYLLRGMWREFNDDVPPEDVAIVRKLKGIPTPSRVRDDHHEYY